MIQEHDCVVLTRELPDDGLQAGDVGTVVHIHNEGEAYEVEFVALNGRTVALSTVPRSQVRPVTARDMCHVREIVAG
jgi:hypothetical protein